MGETDQVNINLGFRYAVFEMQMGVIGAIVINQACQKRPINSWRIDILRLGGG